MSSLVMQTGSDRFGLETGFPLGVEHELLLVDPLSGGLSPCAAQVLADAPQSEGTLASEIFASQIELVTPICRSIDQAAASLRALHEAVRSTGALTIGSGLHPAAMPGEAKLSHSPRYEQVSESLQGLLRAPPASLHVHAGMPDRETAIRACNGMRRHLPLLHSLAANSPLWYGRDSGLASARAAILRSYPRYGVPRWFRDWEDFETCSTELAAAAGVPDYTYFWWDVRPHPQFGTIEVRAPDAQFSLGRVLALAAFIHALARMEAEAAPPPHHPRDTIEAACFQATRYGLEARLPDDHGALRPARDLVREVLDRVRPYALELGCSEALDGIEAILAQGNGADIQRRIHAGYGMRGLVTWLIERTAGM